MGILILEGISKCGKTSWYERNLTRLQDKYGKVLYFHPLLTPIGAMVKDLYMAGETSHEELTGLFLGIYLSSLIKIESLTKKCDLLILDRSIITTLAINAPSFVQHMDRIGGQFHSEDFQILLRSVAHEYLNTLKFLTQDDLKILWFNCPELRDRYSAMFYMNDSYKREMDMIQPCVNDRNIFHIDASESIKMVDTSFASRELL